MPGRGRKKGKYDFIPETYEEEQTQDGEFQDEADFPDASGSPRLTDGETWPDPAEQEEGFRNPGDGEEESEAPEEEPLEKHSIFRPETWKRRRSWTWPRWTARRRPPSSMTRTTS